MSIKDFVEALRSVIEVYYMFPRVDDNNKAPQAPFACYIPSQASLQADNINYAKFNTFTLEYYFKLKDPVKEEEIEIKLNSMGFVYSKSEDTYIENDLYAIYYTL